MKKLWALVLSVLLIILMIPAVTVSATDRVEIPEGAETVDIDGAAFTVIRTKDEFLAMNNVAGKFILANDIDLGGHTADTLIKLPKGNIFDGNGYSIYNYSLRGTADLSTFGINNGELTTIRNINIGKPDSYIDIKSETNGKSIGGVLSYSNSIFALENITVYANINSTGANVGGIAGNIKGNGRIIN